MPPSISDPKVTIELERRHAEVNPINHTKVDNVTCAIDGSYGTPHIYISYRGTGLSTVKRMGSDLLKANNSNWFQATYRELFRLPSSGHMLCRVYDSLGNYTVSTASVTHQSGAYTFT